LREEKIMSPDQTDPREKHIADLHAGIRQIAHDLSNPLGILRMAVYFLQSTKVEGEKREQYLTMMNETIDRVEQQLKRLRALTEPRADGDSPGGEEENRT
jgi:nitrogen-specific signal transduction histidine kinase